MFELDLHWFCFIFKCFCFLIQLLIRITIFILNPVNTFYVLSGIKSPSWYWFALCFPHELLMTEVLNVIYHFWSVRAKKHLPWKKYCTEKFSENSIRYFPGISKPVHNIYIFLLNCEHAWVNCLWTFSIGSTAQINYLCRHETTSTS